MLPDESQDEMQKLEQKARELAAESLLDQAKAADKGISFVR